MTVAKVELTLEEFSKIAHGLILVCASFAPQPWAVCCEVWCTVVPGLCAVMRVALLSLGCELCCTVVPGLCAVRCVTLLSLGCVL